MKIAFKSLSRVEQGNRTPFTSDFGKHADDIYKTLVTIDEDFDVFANVINNNSKAAEVTFLFARKINKRAKVGIALGGVALGLGYLLSRKVNAMNEEIEELKARLEEIETLEDMDISLDDAHVEEE